MGEERLGQTPPPTNTWYLEWRRRRRRLMLIGGLAGALLVFQIGRSLHKATVAEASVVCGEGTLEHDGSRTVARPDGVHLSVENGTYLEPGGQQGLPVTLAWYPGPEFGYGVGEPKHVHLVDVGPGEAEEVVWPMPPGFNNILCLREGFELPDFYDPGSGSRLEVVDPYGYWGGPHEMGCDSFTGINRFEFSKWDQGPAPSAHDGTVEDAFKQDVDGLRKDDEVAAAGYPETEEKMIQVLRGDVTVAVAEYVEQEGRWLFETFATCLGSGLTISGVDTGGILD